MSHTLALDKLTHATPQRDYEARQNTSRGLRDRSVYTGDYTDLTNLFLTIYPFV